MIRPSIVVAEPRSAWKEIIFRGICESEFHVIPVCSADFIRELRKGEADMAIIGPSLAKTEILREIREQVQELPFWIPLLVLATNSSEQLAIAALQAGASEYLHFPCEKRDLTAAARQCLHRSRPWGRRGRPLAPAHETDILIGDSSPMREVKASLSRAALTDSTVLITGETGTGKELAATFVHSHSARSQKPLVTVNCAAIPDSLLESELFGYERGAFTGAQTSRDGKLKAAHGGTIFLDEIGDMSSYAQAKILRAIDTKEIQRLGGTGLSVDVRIIAATNQELEDLVNTEKFRKDLYFRLHVARIHLPPLRERKQDIPAIVHHYIQHFNTRFGRNVSQLTDSALEFLFAYDWPGNVRELKNLLEALFVHCSSDEISADELPHFLQEHCRAMHGSSPGERERMLSALAATNWNKSKAADKLSWSRMTLYRKMAKYQVAGAEK